MPQEKSERALETVYRPQHPLDLLGTVGVLMRGPKDPAMLLSQGVLWRASHTPAGRATLALRQRRGEVHATAWGPGAGWALDQLPALCGADDDSADFDPTRHRLIADTAQQNPGLRLTRTDLVFEALVGSTLEQKVTSYQAYGAWRVLVQRFGERAPGPTPRMLWAPPPADVWHKVPSWAWHRSGVQPSQSRTISHAAARGERIAAALHKATNGDDRDRVLTSLPGIGLWTSAETRARALGDPDAVSVGDYHLAHEVGFALTGSRTDDAGMLDLLAPWQGQRHRVIRLILASGVAEPRRGPRLEPQDHRRH